MAGIFNVVDAFVPVAGAGRTTDEMEGDWLKPDLQRWVDQLDPGVRGEATMTRACLALNYLSTKIKNATPEDDYVRQLWRLMAVELNFAFQHTSSAAFKTWFRDIAADASKTNNRLSTMSQRRLLRAGPPAGVEFRLSAPISFIGTTHWWAGYDAYVKKQGVRSQSGPSRGDICNFYAEDIYGALERATVPDGTQPNGPPNMLEIIDKAVPPAGGTLSSTGGTSIFVAGGTSRGTQEGPSNAIVRRARTKPSRNRHVESAPRVEGKGKGREEGVAEEGTGGVEGEAGHDSDSGPSGSLYEGSEQEVQAKAKAKPSAKGKRPRTSRQRAPAAPASPGPKRKTKLWIVPAGVRHRLDFSRSRAQILDSAVDNHLAPEDAWSLLAFHGIDPELPPLYFKRACVRCRGKNQPCIFRGLRTNQTWSACLLCSVVGKGCEDGEHPDIPEGQTAAHYLPDLEVRKNEVYFLLQNTYVKESERHAWFDYRFRVKTGAIEVDSDTPEPGTNAVRSTVPRSTAPAALPSSDDARDAHDTASFTQTHPVSLPSSSDNGSLPTSSDDEQANSPHEPVPQAPAQLPSSNSDSEPSRSAPALRPVTLPESSSDETEHRSDFGETVDVVPLGDFSIPSGAGRGDGTQPAYLPESDDDVAPNSPPNVLVTRPVALPSSEEDSDDDNDIERVVGSAPPLPALLPDSDSDDVVERATNLLQQSDSEESINAESSSSENAGDDEMDLDEEVEPGMTAAATLKRRRASPITPEKPARPQKKHAPQPDTSASSRIYVNPGHADTRRLNPVVQPARPGEFPPRTAYSDDAHMHVEPNPVVGSTFNVGDVVASQLVLERNVADLVQVVNDIASGREEVESGEGTTTEASLRSILGLGEDVSNTEEVSSINDLMGALSSSPPPSTSLNNTRPLGAHTGEPASQLARSAYIQHPTYVEGPAELPDSSGSDTESLGRATDPASSASGLYDHPVPLPDDTSSEEE